MAQIGVDDVAAAKWQPRPYRLAIWIQGNTMLRWFVAAVLAGVPIIAWAGPIGDTCSARGTWDSATCDCMQRVADIHLTPDDQVLAESYIQRRTTSASIAATEGRERAEQFLIDFSAFGTQSKEECGAP